MHREAALSEGAGKDLAVLVQCFNPPDIAVNAGLPAGKARSN